MKNIPGRNAMRSLLVAGVVLCACSAALAGEAIDQQVATIISEIDGGATVWRQSIALEKLGPDAAPAILETAREASPTVRLACAKALCSAKIGESVQGIKELARLIRDVPDDPVAVMAADMLGEVGQLRSELAIVDLLEAAENPRLKIALARSLYFAATEEVALTEANSTLRKLFKSDSPDIREACALALAEIGDVDADVQEVLVSLQTEPTDRGALARNLMRLYRLQDQMEKQFEAGDGLQDALLNEIRDKAQMYHVDEPVTIEELRDAAAAGMTDALDPFSTYFSEEDLARFREGLTGEYAGVGARVGYPGLGTEIGGRVFSVIRPIYSGPAYGAGLRSYDQIIAVDGKPTKDRKTDELVEEIRGKIGTDVVLTIRRRGWDEDRKITITRKQVKQDSVFSGMLPGGIGYVRLIRFGPDSADDFESALVKLENAGARGMVVDLRNNPGGYLAAARDIADLFLKDDKLIVSSRGRNKRIAPEEELRTQDKSTHPDYPLVLLINERSASASEIVAGALQDHKRATIVGTRTFGKGSVQKVLPLQTTGRACALKLTVAKYYLPSGRSIQRDPPAERGGVAPDIEVFSEQVVEPYQMRDFELLRSGGYLDSYWAAHGTTGRATLERLAEFDGDDEKRYPGFDEWFGTLKGRYERSTARRALRAWVRIQLSDERGEEFVVDFEDDAQLQRGAIEMAKLLNVDTESIEEYRGLMSKFRIEEGE